MLHKNVDYRNEKQDGQLVVELLNLLHGEFLFDPRNASCSCRLNQFDSCVCIRSGAYGSKPGWQGLRAVPTQHYTATVPSASPAPPYPTLPGMKPQHLQSKRTNSEYQRLTIPLKQRAAAKAELLRSIIQKPYHKFSSGIKHYVVILGY